jgi:hypothetical protein
MSTSAIVPISSIDFGSSTATASQQSVFNGLLSQLQQAIGSGDLTSSQTLLNAIDALSPSSPTSSTPLGTFLTGVGSALNDGSVAEAQSALATYQSATPAATPASTSTPGTSATAAQIAANLIQSQNQLNLVTALLGPNSALSTGGASSASSDTSATDGLIGILNAAYGSSSSGSSTSSGSASAASGTSGTSGTSTTSATETSSTPYDALVSSIQASLAAGNGTITPALAYLQASGNFVNTSA